MPPLRIVNRAEAANHSRPQRRGHTRKISFLATGKVMDCEYGWKAPN